jgi:hypothetical protein
MEKQNEPEVGEVAEEVEEIEEIYDEVGNDTTDWKALALKNLGIAKRFKTKIEKNNKEFEEFKNLPKEEEKKAEPEKPEKSNEPDYAKLAFLEQRGLTHPDDQKLVHDEAARLKLPLTDVLGMAHIKSQLETAKDQREALAGMPKGGGSASGKTQQDVDYWLAKGETPDDLELGAKVIAARIQKEKQASKFSDDLYTG